MYFPPQVFTKSDLPGQWEWLLSSWISASPELGAQHWPPSSHSSPQSSRQASGSLRKLAALLPCLSTFLFSGSGPSLSDTWRWLLSRQNSGWMVEEWIPYSCIQRRIARASCMYLADPSPLKSYSSWTWREATSLVSLSCQTCRWWQLRIPGSSLISSLISSISMPAGTAWSRIREAAWHNGIADARMIIVMMREIIGSV